MVTTDGSEPTVASGWTAQGNVQSSGAWYNMIFSKVAGGSESATQSPVTGGSSSLWSIGIWEVNGQAASNPVVFAETTESGSGSLVGQSFVTPQITSTLYLAGIIAQTTAVSVTKPFGITTVDVNQAGDAGGQAVYGHCDSNSATYSLCGVLSAASNLNSLAVLVTH